MTLVPIPPPSRVWAGHGLTIAVNAHHTPQMALHASGELDMASAPLLRACLENQLETGSRYGRLDLSGVTFVDAAGLTAVLVAHRAYRAERGMLVVIAPSRCVGRLVRLLGLDEELLISPYPDARDGGAARQAPGDTGRCLRVANGR